MKRFSFEFDPKFKAIKTQLWPVPARQVWEALSLGERESLRRNAPAFGRAVAVSLS